MGDRLKTFPVRLLVASVVLALAVVVVATGGGVPQRDSRATPEWERPFPVAESVYPFQSKVYEWRGFAYHYVDVPPAGGHSPKGTVLAVHGNGTWSMIYRKLVDPLSAAGFRVILTDHLGFGFSDKPRVSEFDYLPSSHTTVLRDFIADLALEDLYLVLQDWGGPIGLAAGVATPEKVRGLVLMNTWAWQLDHIEQGRTGFMHAVHDRGRHAQLEPEFYTQGELIRRGAIGVAERNAVEGSAEYAALRDAMWGPYLTLEPPHELRYPEVTQPVHISATATVADGAFLDQLDRELVALRSKPVFFAFGDDTAFGPYKVDLAILGGERELCRPGYRPETAEVSARTNCVDDETGAAYWYPLERFLSEWNPDAVVGQWRDSTHGHWVQDEVPSVVVEAVKSVHAAVTQP